MAVQGAPHDRAGRRVPRGDARRRQARELARRHRGARQGRLARRAAPLAAARGARPAVAARLAVDPARQARARRRDRAALGLRQLVREARLPEGVHGRHARLADGVDARRQRRADHERRASSPRSCGAAPRRASRSPCTRSATAPTARRSTRSRRRSDALAAARAAAADRARAAARPGGPPPLRRARRHLLGAVLARAVGPRPGRPSSGPARPTAPTRSGRCSTRARSLVNGSDAPIEELDPLAGIRAGVRRTIDERAAWHPEQCADGRPGVPRHVRRAGVARTATNGAAAR